MDLMKDKLQIIGMTVIFLTMIGIMVYQIWIAIFPFDPEQHRIELENEERAKSRAEYYEGLE